MSGLRELLPPERGFESDNTAGAHPDVVAAVLAANHGHVPPYGDDDWTRRCAARFRDLFGAGSEPLLTFGGTGANATALHVAAGPGTVVVCDEAAHLATEEAGAPARIAGVALSTCAGGGDGKLSPARVEEAAARLAATAPCARHVVSVSQPTEVGTCYSVEELAAVAAAAHRHGMLVHVDGARLANAVAHWGFDLATGAATLVGCGVDLLVFGGTKAGLLGAEAVVVTDGSLAPDATYRRKQAAQTGSKMRFLAAQFLAALDGDRILQWAGHANAAATSLAGALAEIDGVRIVQPAQTNCVFAAMPRPAVSALAEWTPFYVWDGTGETVRFACSWDTTEEDVRRLVAGVRAACANATG